MQKLFLHIPVRMRPTAFIGIYAVAGGLVAVAFMALIHYGFDAIWLRLAALEPIWFLVLSLLVVVAGALSTGLLMSRYFPDAAGSGVPQLKAAYWNEMGYLPLRAAVVKFVGGSIALISGASLGREGPTVFMASGVASWLAGRLGVIRHRRRHVAAAGAAAGLAAAFNTPMAAISFVLEEILDDFNSRLLGGVMVAAVVGAFVVFGLVGRQPAFMLPAVMDHSWFMYIVVPFSAILASLAGVSFQVLTLRLRMLSVKMDFIPDWLRPLAGMLGVWILGASVFIYTGRLGIFGLGYADLSDALTTGVAWKIAGILAAAKLLATVFSYGTGGCGGIFSPTLFIGAMCGFFVAGVMEKWVPLTTEDHLIIAAVGMSACFAAVVRAPITSVLMVFEMTHQFSMVPSLMLGVLISQGVARLAGKTNFYDGVLAQDGVEIHPTKPVHNMGLWRAIPVSALGSRRLVSITEWTPEARKRVAERYPFRSYPVLVPGREPAVVTRRQILQGIERGTEPETETAVICLANQTIGEIEPLLIRSDAGLFLIKEKPDGPVIGLFTLHDMIRAQADIFE